MLKLPLVSVSDIGADGVGLPVGAGVRRETEGVAVSGGAGGEEIDVGSDDGLLAAMDVATDTGALLKCGSSGGAEGATGEEEGEAEHCYTTH